jgi:hypothetical protein
MKAVAEYKIKDKNEILKIYQDDDAESPNDWGNEEVFLVYEHRQFQVNREGFEPKDIHNHQYANIDGEDYEPKYNNYYIFTVYAYIHSGVSLSLGHNGDRWDTSSTGFILVKKDCEFYDNNIQEGKEIQPKEEIAKVYAQNLIKNWNTYLEGNVYGFKLLTNRPYKKEYQDNFTTSEEIFYDEDEIDSCWGFYEDDSNYESILDHLGLKLEEIEEIK